MTSQGRQYPDGPLEARPAWLSDENLRKQAREHFAARPPLADIVMAADGPDLGLFLHSLLAPPAEPGPPYVHTFAPPEPIGQDEDGNDIYPEPGPAYTMQEIPLTELVDPDRPWWLVRAAEACRLTSPLARMAAEAVAAPVRIEVGETLGPPDEFRWEP